MYRVYIDVRFEQRDGAPMCRKEIYAFADQRRAVAYMRAFKMRLLNGVDKMPFMGASLKLVDEYSHVQTAWYCEYDKFETRYKERGGLR